MRISNKRGFAAPALILFVMIVIGIYTIQFNVVKNSSMTRSQSHSDNAEIDSINLMELQALRAPLKLIDTTLTGTFNSNKISKGPYTWGLQPAGDVTVQDQSVKYEFDINNGVINSTFVEDSLLRNYLSISEDRLAGNSTNFLVSSNISDQTDIYSIAGPNIQLVSIPEFRSLHYRTDAGEDKIKEDYPSDLNLPSVPDSFLTYINYYGPSGELMKTVRAANRNPVPIDTFSKYARIVQLPLKDITVDKSVLTDYKKYDSVSIWSDTINPTSPNPQVVTNGYITMVSNAGGQASVEVNFVPDDPSAPVDYEAYYMEDGAVVASIYDSIAGNSFSFPFSINPNTNLLDLDQIFLLNSPSSVNGPIGKELGISFRLYNGHVSSLKVTKPAVVSEKFELRIQNSWGTNLRLKQLVLQAGGKQLY